MEVDQRIEFLERKGKKYINYEQLLQSVSIIAQHLYDKGLSKEAGGVGIILDVLSDDDIFKKDTKVLKTDGNVVTLFGDKDEKT